MSETREPSKLWSDIRSMLTSCADYKDESYNHWLTRLDVIASNIEYLAKRAAQAEIDAECEVADADLDAMQECIDLARLIEMSAAPRHGGGALCDTLREMLSEGLKAVFSERAKRGSA